MEKKKTVGGGGDVQTERENEKKPKRRERLEKANSKKGEGQGTARTTPQRQKGGAISGGTLQGLGGKPLLGVMKHREVQ